MEIIISVFICLTIAYFILILPRVFDKPDSSEYLNWLYAHRGLHDNETAYPENSMAAFKRAIEYGFGIEMDIQLTKDRIPVVFHDFDLKRMCGVDRKVNEYYYSDLKRFKLARSTETIPTFEEVLNEVDGRVPLIVEFKGETTDISLCPIADNILRNYYGMYCMESFNPLMVKWYKDKHPGVMRGQLSDNFMKEGMKHNIVNIALKNLLFNVFSKPDFIAYNKKYPNTLSKRLCRNLYGIRAAAWTIKSEEELAEARKDYDMFIFDSFIPESRS
ncbi:MAG: glycerophosphodiester phosphodiesterase [Lachnospiraceae bacterium]|nr:glycerophosphodiester phosphodiesterase [Lachnospiraceae bacterium]